MINYKGALSLPDSSEKTEIEQNKRITSPFYCTMIMNEVVSPKFTASVADR